MEAFRKIMHGNLAPAGNRISLARTFEQSDFSLSGFSAAWVDSGTSALGLALCDIKKKYSHIEDPKVIIPGYCCPDLVAAAVFAGVRPVAIDTQKDLPFYDLALIEKAIDSNTVAVIGVNFLGYRESLEHLRALADRYSVSLIEDNAQWFPDGEYISASDYVVFSFGRGKPVSLLGGGVLFYRGELAAVDIIDSIVKQESHWKLILKYFSYNLLLNPLCYGVLNRLPFIKLGETRYHPLVQVARMNQFQRDILCSNFELYKQRNRVAEGKYKRILVEINSTAFESRSHGHMLRFPLLCESTELRQNVYAKLRSAGLGVSLLYNQAIDAIDGVKPLIEVPFPLECAASFAQRLLTLPVHEFVNDNHISDLEKIVKEIV